MNRDDLQMHYDLKQCSNFFFAYVTLTSIYVLT